MKEDLDWLLMDKIEAFYLAFTDKRVFFLYRPDLRIHIWRRVSDQQTITQPEHHRPIRTQCGGGDRHNQCWGHICYFVFRFTMHFFFFVI